MMRVSDGLHEKLKSLSQTEARPMQAILEAAVLRYDEEQFWGRMEAAFARPEVQRETAETARELESMHDEDLGAEETWP